MVVSEVEGMIGRVSNVVAEDWYASLFVKDLGVWTQTIWLVLSSADD